MIKEAINKHVIDSKKSLIIGDNISDIKTGNNSEIPFRYLRIKKNINHFSIKKYLEFSLIAPIFLKKIL